MLNDSLLDFIREIESHCTTTAIATFLDSDGEVFVVDLERKKNHIKYGYQPHIKEYFLFKLQNNVKSQASLILRSFTSEIDEFTKLPIKELRGYVLSKKNSQFHYEKISPNMMFACHNTDAQTGEPIALEQSVKYC